MTKTLEPIFKSDDNKFNFHYIYKKVFIKTMIFMDLKKKKFILKLLPIQKLVKNVGNL